MRILVLNLTRLGDLLQSQPAVADLAAAGHEVALLCLDNFAGAAGLMRGVARVYSLNGGRLLAGLDRDWRLALALHRQLVDAIRAEFAPEAVINLTPSQPARLLALGFAPAPSYGFALDDHGFNADTNLWAAFLQLAASSRGASPFNVVDLFRKIAALPGAGRARNVDYALRGPTDAERAWAEARLRESAAASARGYVALQLGASADRRRWPVESFVRAAEKLAAQGHTPVLLGAAGERPLAERFAASASFRFVDLVGGTDLRQLAAVLCNCRLLLTNDTGTMHLAAGLGVRCLAIFLATAQPWDTGPYLPGCVSLEPDMDCHPCAFGVQCPHEHRCRRAIGPEGVAGLALAMLAGGDRPDLCGLPAVPGARAWRSVMGADGLMDLEALAGAEGKSPEAEDRTRFIRLQRELCRRHLDGEPLQHVAYSADMTVEGAQPLGRALDEGLGLLGLLARQGQVLQREPLPAMKTKFLATWQRVRACLESDARLLPLASLWTFEAERPGLGMEGILVLADRYAALLGKMRTSL